MSSFRIGGNAFSTIKDVYSRPSRRHTSHNLHAVHDMAPRAQTAGNPSLRNRNRVTNKTRLKVIKGNIDADPIVLDEDEERARVVSTAGVDAEDANEHHLQAVLSAASHRATLAQKAVAAAANGENKETSKSSSAFIPVPDAAGIVENVDELYPQGRWVEYQSYIKFSDTVDESLLYGLNDGFTYFMDERDAEWLEKNNQEARGEGTSSQASTSGAGTTTRSGRGTKTKGKEADMSAPIVMNENEFELVMGLLERVTHDNTPFLHVTFQQQQGNCIPPFSDYHDVFANELPKFHFARYMPPPILPPPPTLLRMAKTVYPYWRERKIEREGLRIIPNLNFDEADTKNESYICFRRRDTKAIRKTRAAQVSSADKLLRLKSELGHATELARNVLAREMHKRETHHEAKAVWEKRIAFLELKRKHPALAGKDDEDVLVEKERPPKRPKAEPAPTIRIKSRPADPSASPTPAEPQIRPKDRHAAIQAAMDSLLKRMKEMDHGWDDQIDSSYQQSPIPLSDRYFKPVSEDVTISPTARSTERSRGQFCLRLRCGRGGRMHVDRRRPRLRNELETIRQARPGIEAQKFDDLRRDPRGLDSFEAKTKLLEQDRISRLLERWRFDTTFDSTGTDEEDRILFDDYDPKHLRVQAMLLSNTDPLLTDNRLYLFDPQTGTHNLINPVKPIYYTHPAPQKDVLLLQQPRAAVPSGNQPTVPQQTVPPQPVPVAQTVTSVPNPLQSPIKIAPPSAPQHTRASSNGPQRSPSSASGGGVQSNNIPPSSSPSTQANVAHVNGLPSQSSPVNGMPSLPVAASNTMVNGNVNGVMNGVNGSNGLLASLPANLTNLAPAQQQALILQQKQQNLQKFYANYAAMQRNGQANFAPGMMGGANADNISAAASLASAVNSANLMGPVSMNLKLPTQRQMQWAAQTQRSQSAQGGGMVNGNDSITAMQNLQNMQSIQNMQSMQHLAGLGLLPTVNGHGNSHLSPQRTAHSPPNGLGHAMSLSPHMGSPIQTQAHSSPSRNLQTPIPPSPSPLLQHQITILPSQNQGF